jgi:hypothetical protein
MIFPGPFMYCYCFLFVRLSTYYRQSYSVLECTSVKVINVKVSNVLVFSLRPVILLYFAWLVYMLLPWPVYMFLPLEILAFRNVVAKELWYCM